MTTAADAYARLRALGAPVVTNADAGALWRQDASATTHTLRRLARAGLVSRLRHGLWAVDAIRDPLVVAPVLTRPYPCYGSGWTALARHGMIDQIPQSIHVASTARPRVVPTTVGGFVIHQLHPALFGGFTRHDGVALATPEKALFDTVYLLAARSAAHVTLPEVTLPDGLAVTVIHRWVDRIPARRLQALVRPAVDRLIQSGGSASRSAGVVPPP